MATRYWRQPLDREPRAGPAGVVHVIVDRCKGCGFCTEFCPRDVLAESTGYNRRGYHPPEVVKPDLCVECRLCELICPEFAIYVTPVAAAETARA
ncbi:MAG: ferredoxin family protein [Planctomycetota bacterium]